VDLLIPFRGDRDYIGGVDFVAHGREILLQRGLTEEFTDIQLSCYRMVRQCRVRAEVSEAPLSPREFSAILRARSSGIERFVGFAPVVGAEEETERVRCYEQSQLKFVDSKLNSAAVRHPVGVHDDLLTVLVAAIKKSSSESFPTRTGKWIFSSCQLKNLPLDWQKATVSTDSPETARFFSWTVAIDGRDLGTITFFNVSPSSLA
jgi:hypothetical protein